MSKKGLLLVVSAPSGAGKTTVCGEFLEKNPQVKYSVSTTTRPPRVGEKNEADYFFTTKEEFRKSIEKGDFLEYAQVFNEYYGTSKRYVLNLLKNGDDVLLDIDVQGAEKVRAQIPESVQVFILPPSLDELENRLRKRAKDSDEVIKLRLSKAKQEIERSKNYNYIIVNDDIYKAVLNLQNIYFAERQKTERNLDLINSLLEK